MEVILLKTMEPLGNRGDTVKVKPGYARNYLFPKKFAVLATGSNRRGFKEEEKVLTRRDIVDMRAAKGKAAKLAEVSVTITVQVGEEDKVFGSVTSQMVADLLSKEGYEIDKRKILLDEPMFHTGFNQKCRGEL